MKSAITTQISIAADPATVWAVLTDFDAYREWNPFIQQASGRAAVGEQLRLTMVTQRGKSMTFRPKVLLATADTELRWLGRFIVPGLFDGEHWFRLTPRAGGTDVEQGEQFRGLLVRMLSSTLADTQRSFEAFNAALRDRAEAAT